MIDPLAEPLPSFDAAEAAALLERLYSLTGTLSPLHGERDLNFRAELSDGRRHVLKIHNPADGPDVIEMRTMAVGHIARVDPELPVSRIVPTSAGEPATAIVARDGRTSQVQLLSWLDGRHAERDELSSGALRQWGATVARLGRALRGFFHPAGRYVIQWDIRRAGELRHRVSDLGDEERAVVTAVLDRFDEIVAPRFDGLRAQMIHNDMGLENVLVDEASSIRGITDFGDMTHTALVCDLAVVLADVLDGRPDALEMAEPMIAGYTAVTPLEEEEASLLGDLVATRLATAVVVSAWRRRHLEATPQFPGALEFLRQLERHGFAAAAADLERWARREQRTRAALPAPLPTRALLAARRKVLGPLELSYDEPLHLVSGKGVHLFDAAGRQYLDAYNNVPVVGHCHPAVADAISRQSRVLVTNTRYLHETSVELAERLLEGAPGPLDRVLFVNSGSEANDVAWRIACHATGNTGGIVTSFAYHGVTTATTDFSPEIWWPGYSPGHVGLVAPPGIEGRTSIGECTARLASAGHRPAALFVDPGFTSDGILGPAPDWLRQAAGATREAGGIVVGDEVQAGYGRTGESLWSISPSAVEPDLVTLGKPMGNGFPVAAVLGRSELIDPFVTATDYFSTFGGNTLACAAALAVLQVVEDEDLVRHAAIVGSYLRGRLDEVARRHHAVGELRSWGLLCGLEIVRPGGTGAPDAATARAVVNEMRRLGVLVGTTGPARNVVKIRPPLVLEERHADEIADRLEESLGRVSP